MKEILNQDDTGQDLLQFADPEIQHKDMGCNNVSTSQPINDKNADYPEVVEEVAT